MAKYPLMLRIDCPDNDCIRVGNTYYMVSTSMHFFPGCEILRSDNLVDWEHASYVYDRLDSTPAQQLDDGNIYGKGMWAASLRYHEGVFYICFVANDTEKTYLYRSDSIKGPWKKSEIEGFYHDASLLFDDNKVYVAYGHRKIYITELNEDLSAPKKNGFHKLIIDDVSPSMLGCEGTHIYKINGKYYLFVIHSLCEKWFRAEAYYSADSLDGEWSGGDIFIDDNGYRGSGIAQGCIVDTPEGDWYAMLFQDRGGSGRIPYLIPMHFENDVPVIGDNGKLPEIPVIFNQHNSNVNAAVGSDDFSKVLSDDSCFGFSNQWQFNHEPDMTLIERGEYGYYVTTDRVVDEPTKAKNSLTQRMCEPASKAWITVDMTDANIGDIAGICALQYLYGMIGLRVEEDGYSIVYLSRDKDDSKQDDKERYSDKIRVIAHCNTPIIRLGIEAQFVEMDLARFMYDLGDGVVTIDNRLNMVFMLEHFCGYRYALTYFSTIESGGKAGFSDFKYIK